MKYSQLVHYYSCINDFHSMHLLTTQFCFIESEDEVRVVKSAKERSLETFSTHIRNIRSAMKTRDFVTIQSEFDDLSKAMIKAKKLLAQGIPRPLVRILVDLEDFITAQLADKTAFKSSLGQSGAGLESNETHAQETQQTLSRS